MIKNIISLALLIVSVGLNFSHGWNSFTYRKNPDCRVCTCYAHLFIQQQAKQQDYLGLDASPICIFTDRYF